MKRKWLYTLFMGLVLTIIAWPVLGEGEGAKWAFPIDLTPFVQALISLLATAITVKVIPWIKAKTSVEQQAKLKMVVKTLVYAAEQIYQGDGRGSEKLAYVQRHLADQGWALDMAAIEAAVREMNMELPWIAENAIAVEGETE